MPERPPVSVDTLDAQSARILGVFRAAGFERVAPAMLQPAELFLDVAGESLRGRTYVFADPEGEELCLRPDLTVPTCRLHLERHGASGRAEARYCYSGSVFRTQPGGGDATHPREFRQEGLESFAVADREAAEVEVVERTLAALKAAGLSSWSLRLGDLGLFHALLDALDMPARWRTRLRHAFWRPAAFRAELRRLTSLPGAAVEGLPGELIARLDPDDAGAAEAAVADYLSTRGIELIGVRSAGEIAESLLAAALDARTPPLAAAVRDLIERYLQVRGPVGSVRLRLEAMLREQGLDISRALDVFTRRHDLLVAAGIDAPAAEFSAEFGRSFEYYSGFVFEVVVPSLGAASPVAGGGRYDSLVTAVGGAEPVGAVGAAIYSQRLALVAGEGRP